MSPRERCTCRSSISFRASSRMRSRPPVVDFDQAADGVRTVMTVEPMHDDELDAAARDHGPRERTRQSREADRLIRNRQYSFAPERTIPSGVIRVTLAQRASRGWQLAVSVEDRSRRCSRRRLIGRTLRNTRRGNAVRRPGAPLSRPPASTSGAGGTCRRWLGRLRRRPHERERPGFPFLDPEICATALDGEPRPPRALHYLHSERLEGLLVEACWLRLSSRTRRAKWSMRGSVTGGDTTLNLESATFGEHSFATLGQAELGVTMRSRQPFRRVLAGVGRASSGARRVYSDGGSFRQPSDRRCLLGTRPLTIRIVSGLSPSARFPDCRCCLARPSP